MRTLAKSSLTKAQSSEIRPILVWECIFGGLRMTQWLRACAKRGELMSRFEAADAADPQVRPTIQQKLDWLDSRDVGTTMKEYAARARSHAGTYVRIFHYACCLPKAVARTPSHRCTAAQPCRARTGRRRGREVAAPAPRRPRCR